MTNTPQQREPAPLHIVSFAGGAPGMTVAAVGGNELLPLRLDRMRMSFHRLAAVGAATAGIALSTNTYALWARLDDGSILGLHQEDGIWCLMRIPAGSAGFTSIHLPTVAQARGEFHWVELPAGPTEPLLKRHSVEPARQSNRIPIGSESMPQPMLG